MHLLIDGCPLQTPARDRGIGRYTSGLLRSLQQVRPTWHIQVVEHGRLPAIPPDRVHGLPIIRFDAPFAYDLSAPKNYPANDRYYADWLLAKRPDHVLFASVFERLGVVPRFTDRRMTTSAVLYDLIPLLFPDQYDTLRDADPWYARRFRDTCRLDTLFAISEASAIDAHQMMGTPGPVIHNIQGAVNDQFVPFPAERLPEAVSKVRTKFGITAPFLLYVGGEDYRKNLSGAVAGFAALPAPIRDRYQLVIACFLQAHLKRETERTAERLGIGGRVITTGFVSDEELILLYQSCRLFFFPSLYEGLGLPVLEALTCGAPVACSNCSSLPEFAGDVSFLFDPHSPRAMSDALARCLAEPRDQRELDRKAFAATFTWTKTAEKVVAGIETVQRRATNKPRLAWVASTPDRSGDRLNSLDVLAPLARTWEIELVGLSDGATDDVTSRYPLLHPDELDGRMEAVPFDVVAVNIPAGGPDPATLRSVLRHRGLVVLNHPHPSAYPGAEIGRVLAVATVVLVCSPLAHKWARTMTDAPVVVMPPFVKQHGEHLAVWLSAVLDDVRRRLTRTDQPWANGVAYTLSQVTGGIPADLYDEWGRLRAETAPVDRNTGSQGA